MSTGNLKELNLLYLAEPVYGGWVTFTAHLMYCLQNKYKVRLFKVGKRTEPFLRDYGYGIQYQNIEPEVILKLENVLITAIDKNHYYLFNYLQGRKLVIHDPTELKEELISNLNNFTLYTIRETNQRLLAGKGFKCEFFKHPFYMYRTSQINKTRSVSISRIDFDKHIDIILKANQKLKNKIEIYGAVNRLYIFHKLRNLDFQQYYRGAFNKTFGSITGILNGAKYVVDMSAIKNDGSGTQYTFLEAIHNDCCLVLNSNWFTTGLEKLVPNANCLAVGNSDELCDVIDNYANAETLVKNAKYIVEEHADIEKLLEVI